MKIICPECAKQGKESPFEPITILKDEIEYGYPTEITEYQCPEGHRLKIVDFME